MKTLAIALIAASSAILLFANASAQDSPPAGDAAALTERLLVALGAEQSFDDNVKKMALAQIQAQPELASYMDVFEQFYGRFLGYQAMREQLLERYAERFTLDELSQLVTFYESEIGRKSTLFIPQIATQTLQEGTIKSQANTALLQEMVNAKAELLNME